MKKHLLISEMDKWLDGNYVEHVFGNLTYMECRVLTLRFHYKEGKGAPRKDVANYFHLSSTRIAQIEKKALRKLRHELRGWQKVYDHEFSSDNSNH